MTPAALAIVPEDNRHSSTYTPAENLARQIISRMDSVTMKLKSLEDDIRNLWIEFDKLKAGETILGCATKKEFCERKLNRTPRTIQYLLAGQSNSNDRPRSEPRVESRSELSSPNYDKVRAAELAAKLTKVNPTIAGRVRNGGLQLREHHPKKDFRVQYSEADYFARVGRSLALSLLDPRLRQLADIKKKEFTPEAKEGLKNIILNLKEIKTQAQQHIDALNKALERCK
jgi:hypothetical protein